MGVGASEVSGNLPITEILKTSWLGEVELARGKALQEEGTAVHMHCSERTWHIWAIASAMRAQSRQGEVGEVDRVQTESCLGVHDKEFNLI